MREQVLELRADSGRPGLERREVYCVDRVEVLQDRSRVVELAEIQGKRVQPELNRLGHVSCAVVHVVDLPFEGSGVRDGRSGWPVLR